ncbi:MAG: acyl carrier protein [Alphaproteobacteria bacterium]
MQDDPIKSGIKQFILEEFLPGERPEALTDDTPLVDGGVLDSLATLRLVGFLEKQFKVSLAPHEVDAEYLNTLPSIAALVRSKLR